MWQQIIDYSIFQYQNYQLTVGRIIAVIIILSLAIILNIFLSKAIRYYLPESLKTKENAIYIFLLIKSTLVFFISFILAMEAIGVNINFILTSSAAVLIGVGLGVQQIIANIFAGMSLLFRDSFKVGDVIEINDCYGKIQKISLGTTQILTPLGELYLIPNSIFSQSPVYNYTPKGKAAHFIVPVSVSYLIQLDSLKDYLHNSLKQTSWDIKIVEIQVNKLSTQGIVLNIIVETNDVFKIDFYKSQMYELVISFMQSYTSSYPFPHHSVSLVK